MGFEEVFANPSFDATNGDPLLVAVVSV